MAPAETLGASELDELQKKFTTQADITGSPASKDEEDDPEMVAGSNSNASPDKGHQEAEDEPRNRRQREMTTEDGKRIMLVAAKSRVKQVAGSIARTTREDEDGEPPVLSAVGAASVNQAIKSIAIARDFLEQDGLDLAVEVSKRPQGEVKDVIILTLTKHPRGTFQISDAADDAADYVDMRAAALSTPSALAGAIANHVREKKRPRITAIGQGPVFKAITACATARKYLKKENVDIDIVPRFTHVTFENGSDANAVQIIVLPRKLE